MEVGDEGATSRERAGRSGQERSSRDRSPLDAALEEPQIARGSASGGDGQETDASGAPSAGRAGTEGMRTALTLVGLVVGVVWLAVVVLWSDAVFSMTFDDAWYYWNIADHVAAGDGSTFDGVNRTNGYHPLWLAISVPVYLAGIEGMTAGRTLLAVQTLLYGATLVVVGRAVASRVGRWHRLDRLPEDRATAIRSRGTLVVAVAWALACGGPFVVKTFANGMESAVLVLLYAVLLARVLNAPRRLLDTGAVWQWTTGLVLLALLYARTDSAVVAGCLGLWMLAGHRNGELRSTLTALVRVAGPPAVGLVVFLVANQAWFATPLQVSGLHKQADLTATRVVILAVCVALAAAVGVHAWRRGTRPARGARFPTVGALWGATGWYVSGCLLLVGYYHGLQTQQWLWYYAPLALYLVVIIPAAVADMVETVALEARPGASIGRTLAPVAAIVVLPILVAAVIQVGNLLDPDVRSIQEANRSTAGWISAELPPDAVLASWDAGVVGYFSEQRVVNIDGLVNSKEFYDAVQDGTVGAFLRRDGVTYFVNHGPDVDGENPEVRPWLASTFGTEVAEQARVVHHEPFEFSGTTQGPAGRIKGRQLAMFVYEIPPSPPPQP